ncbi:MAG: immunoglobulin domain-containing protein, partial [Akkermansiaceae bacterium]|nr:immunoglobulin domain-containing protein [Verrucomicrobiales bacterium]
IEGWIKVGSTNLSQANALLVEKRLYAPMGNSFLQANGFSLLIQQGTLAFGFGYTPNTTNNTRLFIAPGPDLRDGMFHHVAVSMDRSSTNGGRLYVDGQVVRTFNPTVPGSLSTTAPLNFALNPANLFGGISTSFSGLMDEFAIYARALAAQEIQSIAAAGAAGKCKVPPTILTQPTNQTVTVGSNATFRVVATGQLPLRYQWLKGLSPFSPPVVGATNSTLNLSNVQFTAAGSYLVRITNAFGSVISSNVVLVVNKAQLTPVGLLRYEQTSQWTLQFAGASGENYLVQVSTNLSDWTTIGPAIDLGDGNFGFSDPEQGTREAGFYRIIQP